MAAHPFVCSAGCGLFPRRAVRVVREEGYDQSGAAQSTSAIDTHITPQAINHAVAVEA